MSPAPAASLHPAQPPSETTSETAPETFGLLGPVLGALFLLWILIVAGVAQNV